MSGCTRGPGLWSIDESEGLDVLHNGLELQAAAVTVRGEGSAHAETVRARLLLHDAPLRSAVALHRAQLRHEVGPEDSPLYIDYAPVEVDSCDSAHRPHVEQGSPGEELLAAHGMATCGYRHAANALPGPPDRVLYIGHRPGPHDLGDRRLVQLRVDVVDDCRGHGAVS